MISLTHVIAVQAITYVVSQAAGKFGWKPYTRAVVLTSAIAVMSLYTLSDHFVEVSHNYYNVLGVDRSVSDVRAAYKRASLVHHPDKVAASDHEAAELQFQAIRTAYETLSDSTLRRVYNLFGPDSLDPKRQDSLVVGTLINMATTYPFLAIVSFVLSMGQGSEMSRKVWVLAMAVLATWELMVKFGGEDPGTYYFLGWHLTPWEAVRICQHGFTSFVVVTTTFCNLMFIDMQVVIAATLRELAVQQHANTKALRELQLEFNHMARQPKVDPVTTEKMQQLKRRGPHGATQAPESPAAGEATQTLHEVTENTEVPPVNTVAQPPAAGLARFAPMVLWIAMMWWFSR